MGKKILPDPRVIEYKRTSKQLQREIKKLKSIYDTCYAHVAMYYTPMQLARNRGHHRTANAFANLRRHYGRKGDRALSKHVDLDSDIYELGLMCIHIRQGIIPPLDASTVTPKPL